MCKKDGAGWVREGVLSRIIFHIFWPPHRTISSIPHGVGDVGHHGPDQPHGRLRYGDAEVHCQDQQLHIYSHTQNIVLYVIWMSKGQGFVLSEYLKSSLKKCEKSLSDIKYEISTVRHRTYLMKISHIGSSSRWLSDPAGQDLDYFKANVIELLLE